MLSLLASAERFDASRRESLVAEGSGYVGLEISLQHIRSLVGGRIGLVKIGKAQIPTTRLGNKPSPKKAEQIEREFADAFLKSAEASTAKPLIPSSVQFEKAGLNPATAAFLAVSSVMAPIQALLLAGQSFVQSQPQLTAELDQPLLEARRPLETLEPAVGLFSHPDVPAAQASGESVYLNPQLVPHLGLPVVDWIVGHELGHIESDDGLAAVGRSFVIGQMKADGLSTRLLETLQSAHHELNRRCEFESDREGLEYAVSQGHKKNDVIASVQAFLSAMPADHQSTHPDPDVRVQELKQFASTLDGA